MNKIKSEYQVLKFLSKQNDELFTDEIARSMHAKKSAVSPMISLLHSRNLISMKYEYKTNNLSSPTYRIAPAGYQRLHELKIERRLNTFAAINTVTAFASLLASVLGLVLAAT